MVLVGPTVVVAVVIAMVALHAGPAVVVMSAPVLGVARDRCESTSR
jgi:hypothetical protein